MRIPYLTSLRAMFILVLAVTCALTALADPALPNITGFTPYYALAGTEITITGTDLAPATTVSFNGKPAAPVTANTATSLKVTVPTGATTGKVTLTTAAGTATSPTDFVVIQGQRINPIDGATMVWVPGGSFSVGKRDKYTYNSHWRCRQVTVSGYWLYQHDVTVAQYRNFCAATKRALPKNINERRQDEIIDWADPALQQHPMVNVTWNDAKAYADWAKVSLQTAAQWEYAVRGPQDANHDLIKNVTYEDRDKREEAKFGNWYNSIHKGKYTWPVGSFPDDTGWCGAQDLIGNVWQWCYDRFSYEFYSSAPLTDPTGPLTGRKHELHGGSYADYIGRDIGCGYNRTEPREPEYASEKLGFRCASSAAPLAVTVPALNTDTTIIPPATIAIASITPDCAVTGAEITITGTLLADVTSVTFNGVPAANITATTATSLHVTVPTGATTGKVTVITAAGTATITDNFTVLQGTVTNGIDKAALVWVPGATFTMGIADVYDGTDYYTKNHICQVTLTGYWLYQHDVTVAQYRSFCAATGHQLPAFPAGFSWQDKTGWGDPTLQQHPIVNVTQKDAREYADWAQVKLPTEAQWEYAVLGPMKNNYPWGGAQVTDKPYNGWDQTKCANYQNSYKQGISTRPVGTFPSDTTWCGARDMAGNVMQWCRDYYADYQSKPVTDPTGPLHNSTIVFRGGSWYTNSSEVRCADRYYATPDFYSPYIGFRCVYQPTPTAETAK
ncbi:MAG: SUMF1/EgtB/PvdO family nonheme iron enzyme [bacterium]